MISRLPSYVGCCAIGMLVAPALHAADPSDAELSQKQAFQLATQALQAEADGDFLTRQRLVNEARQVSSECPLVKTQLSEVQLGADHWRSIDECVDLARWNETLAEYARRRGSRELSASEHFALARWCVNQRLAPQAFAHFTKVLRMQPDHLPARAALGYQRVGNEWIAPSEIAAMQRRAQVLAASMQKFGPGLREIRVTMTNPKLSPQKREAAFNRWMAIDDPAAIPAVESVFASASVELAEHVVDWLQQNNHIASSGALTRYALFHPSPAIRSKAVNALQPRPLHEFVPQVIAMTLSPVQAALVPVLNPDGTLAGYRQAFAQESSKKSQLVVIDTTFERVMQTLVQNPSASGDMLASMPSREVNMINRAIEQAVSRMAAEEAATRQAAMQRDNRAIGMRNARIAQFLSDVSGDEIPSDPRGIWRWWDKVNESDSQLLKESRVQRASLTHEIPRYQSARRYDAPDYESASTGPTQAQLTEARNLMRLVASGSGAMPSAECLVAGTMVMSHRGRQAIETLRTGDLVLTRSIQSGALSWQPVVDATRRPPEPIRQITTSGETFRSTGGHLFWVSGKGWTKASKLVPGDVLHTASEPTIVARVEDMPAEPTFNLIVAENANYFVGKELVLTHDVTEREATRIRVPGLHTLALAP